MLVREFPARIARRLPDPVFQNDRHIERYVLFVSVRDVPEGLPDDPNARVPDVSKRVYREVEKSLLNVEAVPGTFHLKHKGITLIAQKVDKAEDRDSYRVAFDEGHGIVDGGHTYELIQLHKNGNLPADQFVKFEILTNVPDEWIVDISGGLNTALQVQPMSLDYLGKKFDWIREELRSEPYFESIAWRENEDGELDARDLVALMTCFNISEFPNTMSGDTPPVMAYEKKSQALKLFEDKPVQYEELRPILKDILVLHDLIRLTSREHWNESGGVFGNLAFVEKRKKGYTFPFLGRTGEFRLMNGALYPMLGAFRWMVERDSKGRVRWRGGFEQVKALWEVSAAELMKMTQQASVELGRNPNAIGKSRNHWSNVYARVAMRDLMRRNEAAGK
jgi:hypothetical protein